MHGHAEPESLVLGQLVVELANEGLQTSEQPHLFLGRGRTPLRLLPEQKGGLGRGRSDGLQDGVRREQGS